ncbi:MAG: hypothetical protein JRN62_03300 [Nitrososphaerota archaeon]|jgi:hypothetical protein|nr:hypothetical protein [Nitrososphaerota archaeon]MDG6948624.1 hypothetical protein [Nitrososphaerota archaeon]
MDPEVLLRLITDYDTSTVTISDSFDTLIELPGRWYKAPSPREAAHWKRNFTTKGSQGVIDLYVEKVYPTDPSSMYEVIMFDSQRFTRLTKPLDLSAAMSAALSYMKAHIIFVGDTVLLDGNATQKDAFGNMQKVPKEEVAGKYANVLVVDDSRSMVIVRLADSTTPEGVLPGWSRDDYNVKVSDLTLVDTK